MVDYLSFPIEQFFLMTIIFMNYYCYLNNCEYNLYNTDILTYGCLFVIFYRAASRERRSFI